MKCGRALDPENLAADEAIQTAAGEKMQNPQAA